MDVLSPFSLSSVILIGSSTGCPVRVLMVSIQAVRGLPRLGVRIQVWDWGIGYVRLLKSELILWFRIMVGVRSGRWTVDVRDGSNCLTLSPPYCIHRVTVTYFRNAS